MKILLTGSNGYVGSRLLQLLVDGGHEIICMVRERAAPFQPSLKNAQVTVVIADLLDPESLQRIPKRIDIAYYLVHSMADRNQNFVEQERKTITNFLMRMQELDVEQVIYLGGLCNEKTLSPHLASRYRTELAIKNSGIPFTILRAGIIIGSGSASFEIVRDLAEKLPIMVAPKWIDNPCQPIAIQDVLFYLVNVMKKTECLNQCFDIGGPDVLSYKEMLLGYAKARNLKRHIFTVPVLTPKLSSYWLYFVTSVNFRLASALVDSVKNKAICLDHRVTTILPHTCLNYPASIAKAFDLIEQSPLIPSWKDSLISQKQTTILANASQIPQFGCVYDKRVLHSKLPFEQVVSNVWSIGGQNGWYGMNWAWRTRGFFDKLVGGIGLQRGRTHPTDLTTGSTLDFWRVVIADKEKGHLLLYAEMKLPGEAWLEFQIFRQPEGCDLKQTASFRPKGLLGRLYWYAMMPMHYFIFHKMAKVICSKHSNN
ncbi:MAG: SDR family oxidoreductase [Parachlamydiaceae bacterium]|nr:SDR family oxidoreductase [Parachlamydiaceae bacterium]